MKKFNNTIVFTVADTSDKLDTELLRQKVREVFDLLPHVLKMYIDFEAKIGVTIDYFDTDEEEN